jgi:hypothetical protein
MLQSVLLARLLLAAAVPATNRANVDQSLTPGAKAFAVAYASASTQTGLAAVSTSLGKIAFLAITMPDATDHVKEFAGTIGVDPSVGYIVPGVERDSLNVSQLVIDGKVRRLLGCPPYYPCGHLERNRSPVQSLNSRHSRLLTSGADGLL